VLADAEPAVVVDELTIRYGDRTAVDGLSFSARTGEVLAVLGRNGAGKTSTVECLEGYRRPTSGRVRVLGLDPVTDHARLVPDLGVMLQEGGVATAMRPNEALALYAAYYDDPLDPVALLDRVGLAEVARTPWRRLSGGERQRISLALAVIGRPKVAFLDEPTAGVDVHGRQVIRQIVRELRDDGVCVLLTTHELDEAEKVADRVAIVDRGRLLAIGTLDELTRDDQPEIRFTTPTALDVTALSQALGIGVEPVESGPNAARYRIAAAGDPDVIARLTTWLSTHGHVLGDLQTGRRSLERLFLDLTGDDSGAADPEPASPSSRRASRARSRS
jgi:ABC-2 type transport system ATP-binding protein